MRLSIVGQKHRDLDPYLTGILPGTPVTLVREPTNGYDPNAIQVWIAGKMVGYLPKNQNADLAARIDRDGVTMAMDGHATPPKTMHATFARSPNSRYPQVEIDLERKTL
jgi:HIRAN domain